jgi:hypothetical protein
LLLLTLLIAMQQACARMILSVWDKNLDKFWEPRCQREFSLVDQFLHCNNFYEGEYKLKPKSSFIS